MKTLTFTKPHRLSQLHDELLAAFPDWVTVTPGGERVARAALKSADQAITLDVPDEADEAAVAAVVAAHDPAAAPMFQGEYVASAAQVDAITARRIRAAIGGADPVQEQLKQLRLSTWADYVLGHQTDFTAEDVARAQGIVTAALALHAAIEAIRAEGRAFKQARGW